MKSNKTYTDHKINVKEAGMGEFDETLSSGYLENFGASVMMAVEEDNFISEAYQTSPSDAMDWTRRNIFGQDSNLTYARNGQIKALMDDGTLDRNDISSSRVGQAGMIDWDLAAHTAQELGYDIPQDFQLQDTLRENLRKQREFADDTFARAGGMGILGMVAGGFSSTALDPAMIIAGAYGLPVRGISAASTTSEILAMAGKQTLKGMGIGAGIETGLQTQVYSFKNDIESPYGIEDALVNIAFSAGFDGTLEGISAGLRGLSIRRRDALYQIEVEEAIAAENLAREKAIRELYKAADDIHVTRAELLDFPEENASKIAEVDAQLTEIYGSVNLLEKSLPPEELDPKPSNVPSLTPEQAEQLRDLEQDFADLEASVEQARQITQEERYLAMLNDPTFFDADGNPVDQRITDRQTAISRTNGRGPTAQTHEAEANGVAIAVLIHRSGFYLINEKSIPTLTEMFRAHKNDTTNSTTPGIIVVVDQGQFLKRSETMAGFNSATQSIRPGSVLGKQLTEDWRAGTLADGGRFHPDTRGDGGSYRLAQIKLSRDRPLIKDSEGNFRRRLGVQPLPPGETIAHGMHTGWRGTSALANRQGLSSEVAQRGLYNILRDSGLHAFSDGTLTDQGHGEWWRRYNNREGGWDMWRHHNARSRGERDGANSGDGLPNYIVRNYPEGYFDGQSFELPYRRSFADLKVYGELEASGPTRTEVKGKLEALQAQEAVEIEMAQFQIAKDKRIQAIREGVPTINQSRSNTENDTGGGAGQVGNTDAETEATLQALLRSYGDESVPEVTVPVGTEVDPATGQVRVTTRSLADYITEVDADIELLNSLTLCRLTNGR